MTEFISHPISIIVRPKGEPIYSERITTVSIRDDAAGPFVVVEQEPGHVELNNCIALEHGEWPLVRAAIEQMMGECTRLEREGKSPRADEALPESEPADWGLEFS